MKKTKLFYEAPEQCDVMLTLKEPVLAVSAGSSISDVEDIYLETIY